MWTNQRNPPGTQQKVGDSRSAYCILSAVGGVFAVSLLPKYFWEWQIAVVLLLVIFSLRWHFPIRKLGQRLLVLGPFLALLAVGVLWQPDWPLRIANLCGKAILSLWIMSLLIHVVAVDEFVAGLHRLHLPRIWVELLAFLLRYFAVLSEEWQRMQLARQARTFRRRSRMEFRILTNALGSLFIRAYERAERLHRAMLARGYKTG